MVGADITQFRKGMRDIRNQVGVLSESMAGMAAVGRTMTFTLTAPLVTLATYAGQAASSFDASMRNINSIAQLSEQQFADLKDQVLAFASTTRAGVVPATDALYEIFSAGVTDITLAMAVWETSTRVAEAGLANLEKTTNAVTATIAAYGLEAGDAARVGDVWTHMVALGVGSLEDFLANSQKVLPLSNALGISFEDLGATVAFLSQQGGGAKKAMTALAMLESNLLKPTESLKAAFQRLGVTTGNELIAKFGGVSEAIIAIHGAAEDPLDFASMFSKTGLEAALSVTNNVDKARASIADFHATVAGATDRAWAEQMKSFAAQFDLFKTSVEAAAIAVGEVLLPMITPVIQKATELFLKFSQLNPRLLEFGVVVAGAVAAAGPIIWLLSSLITPAGLAAAAIAALVYEFTNNFANIETVVKTAITNILGPDGLQKLTSLYDQVVGILFPEDEKQAFVQELGPITLNTADLITVEPGDTLWDIFINNGYSDVYTWERFKEVTGMQNPGLLKVGDVIRIPSGFGQTVMDSIASSFGARGKQDALDLEALGMVNFEGRIDSPVADVIIERIQEAVNAVIPQIGPILAPILQSVVSWADGQIGAGLSALSSLFEPSSEGGNSPLYLAVSALLDGDITRAINAVVPNLGTKIGDQVSAWAKDIGSKTGEIQAGAKTLLDSMGKWIETEGVPTIARSIGYFAGHVVLALNSAISSAFSYLTGGQAGKDAQSAGSFLGDAVLTPLAEGWGDAMSGAGVTGVADMFFSGIETALLAGAATWVLLPAVGKVIIGAIFRGIAATAVTGAHVLPVLGRLATGMVATIAGSTIFQGVASAIALKILAVRVALTPLAGTGMMYTLGTAIAGAASAVTATTSWVVASATSVVNAVGAAMATGLASFKSAIAALAPSMWAALGPIMLVAGAILAVKLQLDAFNAAIDEAKSVGQAAGPALHAGGFKAVDEQDFNDQMFAEFVRQHGDNLWSRYMWGTATFQTALAEARNSYFAIGADTAAGYADGVNQNAATATSASAQMATDAAQATRDGLESNSPSQVFYRIGADTVAGFQLGFTETLPTLVTTFTTTFGADGALMTEVNTFSNTMAIKKGEITGHFRDLKTTSGAELVGMAVLMRSQVKIIVSEIDKITKAAKEAAGAMAAIGASAPNNGGKPEGFFKGGGVAGGVPITVGETGKELFVPPSDGNIVPANMLKKLSDEGSGGQQSNVINIYGVQDVDKLIYELRRRGIKLK